MLLCLDLRSFIVVKAIKRLRDCGVPCGDYVSHLRRYRGLKLDLWNRLRGLKEPHPPGHLNGDVGSLEPNSGKSNHRVSLCVCLILLAICSFLSFSKFSCFDLHSKSLMLLYMLIPHS